MSRKTTEVASENLVRVYMSVLFCELLSLAARYERGLRGGSIPQSPQDLHRIAVIFAVVTFMLVITAAPVVWHDDGCLAMVETKFTTLRAFTNILDELAPPLVDN